MTWEDYVHLAFDEIRIAGAGSPQVARRLRAALEDLLTVAPQDRKACLQDQLALLHSGTQQAISEPSDVVSASQGECAMRCKHAAGAAPKNGMAHSPRASR
jgi:uncharacterized membrane protein